MNTNISGKQNPNSPLVLGPMLLLGSGQTLDHFSAPADGTAQDHAENHAEDLQRQGEWGFAWGKGLHSV